MAPGRGVVVGWGPGGVRHRFVQRELARRGLSWQGDYSARHSRGHRWVAIGIAWATAGPASPFVANQRRRASSFCRQGGDRTPSGSWGAHPIVRKSTGPLRARAELIAARSCQTWDLCFWDLTRGLRRVDARAMTRVGTMIWCSSGVRSSTRSTRSSAARRPIWSG
jgi:hypothetical protein